MALLANPQVSGVNHPSPVPKEATNTADLEVKKVASLPEGFKLDFNLLFRDRLVFNQDGSHVAYVARYGSEKNPHECVFVDDQRGPEFAWIQNLAFDPDGRTVGYIAGDYEDRKLVGYLVLGDRMTRISPEITNTDSGWGPIFSPDGKAAAFVSEENGKQRIKMAEVPNAMALASEKMRKSEIPTISISPEFDRVDDPVFSPDGTSIAYIAEQERKQFVMLGKKKLIEGFDDIANLNFLANGRDLVARIWRNGKWFVIIGEKQEPEYDQVWGPFLSPDRKIVAYSATQDGSFFVNIDGVKKPTQLFYHGVAFGRSGKSQTYWTLGPGNRSLIIGVKRGPEFTSVGSPTFSPDGTVAAYAAQLGNQYFIVVGDKRGPEADAVFWKSIFSPDGKKIGYGDLRNGEFKWEVMDVH